MNHLVKLSHHNRYTDNSVKEGGEKNRKRRRMTMMIISNHELVYLKVQADICEYMKIPRRADYSGGSIFESALHEKL